MGRREGCLQTCATLVGTGTFHGCPHFALTVFLPFLSSGTCLPSCSTPSLSACSPWHWNVIEDQPPYPRETLPAATSDATRSGFLGGGGGGGGRRGAPSDVLRGAVVPQVEQSDLERLFDKYVPYLINVIVEGVVDGRQGEKLKTIVPQTDLNMVRSPRSPWWPQWAAPLCACVWVAGQLPSSGLLAPSIWAGADAMQVRSVG